MAFSFTPANLEKVQNGSKTQTRRPAGEGDQCFYNGQGDIVRVIRNDRSLYHTGQRHAITPGRGQKGVGFVQITDIRRERLSEISEADAVAEGCQIVPYSLANHDGLVASARGSFIDLWQSIYRAQKGKRWQDDPMVYVITFKKWEWEG